MHEYSKRIGEHIKSCYGNLGNMNREELCELKDWACVMKDLTEYDFNKRVIEAMDEEKEEEKLYGRMGYDRYRYSNGRFAPKGKGRKMGYTPYKHMMEDGIFGDEYDMYDEMPYPMTGYRMGYTTGTGQTPGMNRGGGSMGTGGMRYGYDHMNHPSRYGQAYDEYDQHRRHYTETKSPEDKQMMKHSMNEIFSDMENMIQNIMEYADAADKPELKQKVVAMAQKVQGMK